MNRRVAIFATILLQALVVIWYLGVWTIGPVESKSERNQTVIPAVQVKENTTAVVNTVDLLEEWRARREVQRDYDIKWKLEKSETPYSSMKWEICAK
jgi:hypothetical protein